PSSTPNSAATPQARLSSCNRQHHLRISSRNSASSASPARRNTSWENSPAASTATATAFWTQRTCDHETRPPPSQPALHLPALHSRSTTPRANSRPHLPLRHGGLGGLGSLSGWVLQPSTRGDWKPVLSW